MQRWAAAQEYNKTISTVQIENIDKIKADLPPYADLLNLANNGIMGYIMIPAINIDLPIYHGTTGTAMEKGAGHMEGTSLPVGGIGTHAVISAHSGMASAKLFTDLDKLKPWRYILHHGVQPKISLRSGQHRSGGAHRH